MLWPSEDEAQNRRRKTELERELREVNKRRRELIAEIDLLDRNACRAYRMSDYPLGEANDR